MDTSVELLNAWGAAWASFMTRALVDSSVLLAVVLAVWLPLRKKMSAQFAHGLFLLVLLKLAVPIPVTWSWTAVPSMAEAARSVSGWVSARGPGAARDGSIVGGLDDDAVVVVTPVPEPEPIISGVSGRPEPRAKDGPSVAVTRRVRPSLSASAVMLVLWAATGAILLVRFARAMVNTRRLLREAIPLGLESGEFAVDLEALRRDSGVRVPVRWAVSPEVATPAVGGLVRPTVVMPPDLEDGLTPRQLRWVLLHELAHVRRGDLWVVTAQRIIQAVFFFHPAVHLASWILDQLREYACDDAALMSGGTSRRDCGEGFLTVVGRTVERPCPSPALGLFESRMLIRRRLIRILDSRRPIQGHLSRRATAALVMTALVVLPYGRVREAAADLAERSRLAAIATSADEPRLFAVGSTFLHDDRASSAGAPRRVVLAVAYSPDGSLVASAGEDAAICLRDARTGAVQGRLEGHGDSVASIAFSPDGKTLASGGYDRTIRLWDVATRSPRATLSGHENWVFAVAYSPDGRLLASAGSDKAVRLWDAATGHPLAVLAGHASAVRALAFHPNGRRLASAGADREAIIWDTESHRPVSRIAGHRGTVRSLAYAPDGRTLATAGEDGEIKLWEARTGRELAAMTGHGDMVLGLAFSPGGSTLASCGMDGAVKLWDPGAGRERASLPSHGEAVSALAFAPGARHLATAGYDGTVSLWDPAAPVLSAASALDFPDEARAVAFANDGRNLFATGRGETLSAYDPSSGLNLRKGMPGGGICLAVSADNKTLASGAWDGRLRLISADTGAILAAIDAHPGGVRALAFGPDGTSLATGGQDGAVALWDVASRSRRSIVAANPAAVTSVRFSPDGRSLAVASGDRKAGSLALYRLDGRRIDAADDGHARGVSALAFSSDGRLLAAIGADGLVSIRDADGLSERSTIRVSDGRTLAFRPGGHVLATGHDGGDSALWDADTGRKLATLKGHADDVLDLAFSPDGATLATASKDRQVRLWNLSARKVAPRASLKADLGPIGAVAISPDNKTYAVAEVANDSAGLIALWDVAGRRVRAILSGHERGVASLAFSPDGKTLASSAADRTIRLWDVATGNPRSPGEFAATESLCHLAFSPDGATLAAAGLDRSLTFFEVADGSEIARLDGFRGPLRAIAYSPDGRFLAVGGGDRDGRRDAFGEVKILDADTRAEVADIDGLGGSVLALTFSADGSTLAGGGLDSTARLWDASTGAPRLSLGGFPDCVRALGLSPDGSALAVAGRGDGTVTLFDTGGGGEISRLVGHGCAVLGLAFAPDGRSLVTSGGVDRSVKLWDVPGSGMSAAGAEVR